MWLYSLILFFCLALASPQEAIREEVLRRFGDTVHLQRVKVYAPPDASIDRIELDMEYGRSRAVAYLYSGNSRYQALLDVLWKVRVYVALEDIPQGSPIRPELFLVQERFFRSVPSDLRLKEEDFSRYVASTRIAKGTVLRRSLLKEVPAVRAGEPVEAVYKSGALEISFQAIAVDTGSVGRVIRIKKDERLLRARVISRGRVEVLP